MCVQRAHTSCTPIHTHILGWLYLSLVRRLNIRFRLRLASFVCIACAWSPVLESVWNPLTSITEIWASPKLQINLLTTEHNSDGTERLTNSVTSIETSLIPRSGAGVDVRVDLPECLG
jgi:hypothetical protein